ncbi:hypothetical protein LQW54_002559 [Pestalotiopsis sp. IQ-011]
MPKVNVVFWDKQTPQSAFPSALYQPPDLRAAGYAYEYLSPDNLALPEANVINSTLAPTAQSFRVLVIRGNSTLTPEGIDHVAHYAEAGLPVVISGPMTYSYVTANTTAISGANETLESLISAENVHQVPYQDLAASIASLGIVPTSRIDPNGTWYTRWRELTNGDVYIFVYNEGDYSTGTITFKASGSAYLLNAWTGGESRNLETTIIKLNASEPLETHVTSRTASVLDLEVSSLSLVLSSGETVDLGAPEIDAAYSIKGWKLVVEQWLPPDNLYDLDPDAKKVNLTMNIEGPVLSSWSDLGLADMSGIGFYTAGFDWANDIGAARGAYLSLPAVEHGLTGVLNGQPLPAFDITNPRLDVSPFLVDGTNSLTLRVASTVWNSARAYWDQVETAGKGPSHGLDMLPDMQDCGISGEVVVTPYAVLDIN